MRTPHQGDAPLCSVYGIGETRADKLKDAGIQTTYQLSQSRPTAVSNALGVEPDRAESFIAAARTTVGHYPEADQ